MNKNFISSTISVPSGKCYHNSRLHLDRWGLFDTIYLIIYGTYKFKTEIPRLTVLDIIVPRLPAWFADGGKFQFVKDITQSPSLIVWGLKS